MEPDILASSRMSAAPGVPGWRSPADETVQEALESKSPKTPLLELRARSALRKGSAAHAMNGNGNGNGNGHAMATTWPAVVRGRPGLSRLLPAYQAPEERGFYLRSGKRALDVVGALAGLILTSPLLLLAAILIKLESRGPVVYKSIRIGRGARPFTFYKLRSMVDGADQRRHALSHLNETDGPVFKMTRDPRVTRIGRLLRMTSLDEFPQLWNVLRGEMSLVGPRPPIAEEVVQYEPWQLRRLDVLPGITCLWQISGRSRIGFQEWMRLDLEYIKHRSLWLDLKILVRTIPAVLSREGAY